MSTIWRVFEPILEIQQHGSTERAPELAAALAEHIDWTRNVVETALNKAPDDDVRQRLEHALDRFRSVLSEIDHAIETGDAGMLAAALAQNFAGAAVRTEESVFELLSRETFSAPPPPLETPVAPLSGGDDLRPLHGAEFHPSIVAQAGALGRDPRRLYDFVAAFDHALYAGHFRAPFEVLAGGIGNAADLSGLLAELLRASGIRAKLVHGMIRMPRRTAAAWLDVHDPEAILRDAGFTAMASAETIDILPHVHVRALLGERWIDLDPSVRPMEILSPGDRTWTEQPWNEAEFLGDTDANDSPLAYYERRLGAAEPRVRRRAAPDPAFPPPLPFEILGFSNEQNAFPPDQEHRFGFQLVGPNGVLLEHRFAAPGHSRERIALRWSPATKTAEALIEAAGTAVAAPAFALDLRPRLEIGTTVIEGTGHAPAGTQLHFHISVETPDFRLARRGEARPLCGTDWELAFEGPGSLFGPVPDDPPNTPLVAGARSWGEFPTPVMRAYHRRLARAARRVAALTGASGFSGTLVTMCAASLETFVIGGVAARRRPSGLLLDVKNIELRLYDSGGTASLAPFVELFFGEGSQHEASVLIDHLGLDAISAVSALRMAAAENNPLRVIRAEAREEIETLDQPPRVKRTLAMLLGISGRESITISQRPIVFGMREISAWIARGGPAPSSDYAIAGLSGGYTRDEPRKPPKVKIVDLPKEKLTVVRQAIDYGAIAWDEDGNDYTSMIAWSSQGNLPGGGAGGSATYTPPEAGTTVVVASVDGGMLENTGGGGTDFSNCVACDVKVVELVFDQSPELIDVPPGSAVGHFERMGRYHYRDKDPTPSPAVLAAKKSGTAQLHLRVGPLTSAPAQLRIEGSGRGEGKELFTIRGQTQVSKGFDGQVQVEVTGGDTIGIADVIAWKFTINSFAPLEEETKVEVFVAGDWADAVDDYHKFYYEIFKQACTWAKGKSPGDTEKILNALLHGRKGYDIKFSYARDSGNFLDGLLRARCGHCEEMALWMLALAAVHGIPGRVLQIGVVSLEESPTDSTKESDATGWRWKSMRVGLKGINNPIFDDKNPDNIPDLVIAGEYAINDGRTDATSLTSSDQLKDRVWQFNTHKLAVFNFGKGPMVYDASPHNIPEPFALQQHHIGRVVLPTTDPVRSGYLTSLMTYLVGIIRLSDGTWAEATVLGTDVLAVGEPLAVDFRYL